MFGQPVHPRGIEFLDSWIGIGRLIGVTLWEGTGESVVYRVRFYPRDES